MKKILLLGATGSVGKTTLNLVQRNPELFQIVGATAHSRFRELEVLGAVMDIPYLLDTTEKYDFEEFLKKTEPDIVINGISGFAGLQFSIDVVTAGIPLALANKESTVTGGELLVRLAAANNVPIIPLDSEHSAIAQCLIQGENKSLFGIAAFEKIYLTCSGGPFFGWTHKQLEKVTIEKALDHPTWSMGTEITVDSATLANKCLEVFETMYFFGATADQIDILIHPQSIVHSMVQFPDSSVLAQLSPPNMELPISYALNFPERLDTGCKRPNFFDTTLEFKTPDRKTFRSLQVLDICTENMKNFPIIFNAVNEVARDAFLNKKISFLQIFDALEAMINKSVVESVDSIEKIFDIDAKARNMTNEWLEKQG
jgi:1-deoxy-D-xylulose-5-phosphate reductoisomerase